jgi:hypothetical protein
MAEYSDYAIVGVINAETGEVAMQAAPANPEAASYEISGSINLSTGEIAIVALPVGHTATCYTITGSLNPQTGQLVYVCAKPGSFHRPKYWLSGSIDIATGRITVEAESQQSSHPNYRVRNKTSDSISV